MARRLLKVQPVREEVVEIVEGAGMGHLWVGEPAVRTVLSEVSARLCPDAPALAWEWPEERARSEGAMERWSDL